MSVTSLDTPFIEGGLHATNFFNGRILSREDLQREQDAERAIHLRLGGAIGHGIAHGFEVEAKAIGGSSIANPVVTVHAGLAVNRAGQTLTLDRDVDVALKKPTAPQDTGTQLLGSFDDCAPPGSAEYVVGTGVYLLTVAPARVPQGLALVSGLGNGTATCNVKEVVEGVQFRLFQVTALSPAELGDEAHLQNVAAYKFFLAERIGPNAARDPFGAAALPPTLTDAPVTDCDVPLALLHWTTIGGLRWVDLWSVRRRLLAPRAHAALLPGAAREEVGEAMLLQFAGQVGTLRSAGGPSGPASDVFHRLPPAGLLPVSSVGPLLASTPPAFFAGFTTRGPLYIEGAALPELLRLATSFPPIAVGDPELVWLYLVRENQQPSGQPAGQPYVVFAQGAIPCQAGARFDVARFDYASLAIT